MAVGCRRPGAGERGPLLVDQGHPSTPPGLSLVVGLVLYISSINDEVMNRPSSSEQYFHYRYGWSFAFAASSFLLKEVMSVGPRLQTFEWGPVAGACAIPGSRWKRRLWVRLWIKRRWWLRSYAPGPGGGGSGSSNSWGPRGEGGWPGLPDLGKDEAGDSDSLDWGGAVGREEEARALIPGFWERRKLEAWNPGSWERRGWGS